MNEYIVKVWKVTILLMNVVDTPLKLTYTVTRLSFQSFEFNLVRGPILILFT